MKISIFAAPTTLCYTKPMTDINKVIMEKAQGGAKLKPDEQRKFLGTFEERVLASCSIEQANTSLVRSHFKEVLSKIVEEYHNTIFLLNSQNLQKCIVQRTQSSKVEQGELYLKCVYF